VVAVRAIKEPPGNQGPRKANNNMAGESPATFYARRYLEMKRKHKWKWVGCWWCTLCGTVRMYSDKTYSIYYLRPKGLKPTERKERRNA